MASALSRPLRPLMSSFGCPVTSMARSVVTLASSAAARIVILYLPGATEFGGWILSFTSFDWPGIDRNRAELLAAIGLREGALEILRRLRRQIDQDALTAVVLDPTWKSKLERAEPRSSGSCGRSVSLAGSSLANVTVTGRLVGAPVPTALTVSTCVAIAASRGTSTRSSSDTVELVPA